MSQFKVGDTVRRLHDSDVVGVNSGTVHTVSRIQGLAFRENANWIELEGFGDTVFGSWNFELVDSAEDKPDLYALRDQIKALNVEIDAASTALHDLHDKRVELHSQLREQGFALE
tara:strand:+ start:8333 stop:8677 length:345 start_codon:yes stop_codon:yes gene_type:complete